MAPNSANITPRSVTYAPTPARTTPGNSRPLFGLDPPPSSSVFAPYGSSSSFYQSSAVETRGIKDLKKAQHELFNKERYSDLFIKCKSRVWKCHRAILCPRCPFFEAACGGQFTEASSREIDLSDDDETALGIMLQYLYTYEIFNHRLATATSFQLIILGDKYELEELRELGIHNLSNEISNLTPSNGQWVAEWYPQICQLEQKGTRALQVKLESMIAKHAGELIKHDAIRDLIASDGSLAVMLIEKLASPGLASPKLASTAPSIFSMPGEGTGPGLFGAQAAQKFGGATASTSATFGTSFSSPSTTS